MWVPAWHVSAHLLGACQTWHGGAPQQGGQSHCQMFDEVEWYGVVAFRRGQEVRVRASGYSAEVYAPSVGGVGQVLLQGVRA